MHVLDLLRQVAAGIGATVSITFAALVAGALLGMPLALARRSEVRVLHARATAWVQVLRGVPPLVWLLIVFLGLGRVILGMSAYAAGIVVFSLVASAFFCEIYVGALRGVPRGQFEAIAASALPRGYAFRSVLVPQALRIGIPAMASYGIGLLKDTALVSVIGVQDITFEAGRMQAQSGDGLGPFLAAGLLYVLLSLPLAVLGRIVAARLHRPSGARKALA